MELNSLHEELAALEQLTIRQLQERYAELFGDSTNNRSRVWLVRRLLWRLQALAEGDLSERARTRAAELAQDADLRTTIPRPVRQTRVEVAAVQPDDRLPPPGTILLRRYKGLDLQVEVLARGFRYAGQTFSSLSAVAKAITGSHCNGFHFFKLGGGGQ